MAQWTKFKRNEPGSSGLGCGNQCTNTCCPEEPPAVIDLFIGEAGTDCACLETTVSYSTAINPDGMRGVWSNTFSIECDSPNCTSQSILLELWCGGDCDTNHSCSCGCTEWAVRINEGTIKRVKDSPGPPAHQCCCTGVGGRDKNIVYLSSVTAGTHASYGCDGDAFFVVFHWDADQTCQADTAVNGCCVYPIQKVLNVEISNTNACSGTTWTGTVTHTGVQCGQNPCYSEWSTTSPITVECEDSYGNCYDVDVNLTLRCKKCDPSSGFSQHNECDSSDWELDITGVDCWDTFTTGINPGCSCPDCEGVAFEIEDSFTLSGLDPDCDCDGIQYYSVKFFEPCVHNRGCQNTNYTDKMIAVLYHYDEQDECACGHAELEYEAVDNQCGCVGQWCGRVAVECKDGGECTEELVLVRMCAHCDGCDFATDCDGCAEWELSINNGVTKKPVTENVDCCCNALPFLYFHPVVAGSSGGACSGKTFNVKILPSNSPTLTVSLGPTPCKTPIFDTLDIDLTDTCLAVVSKQLVGGLTCTNPLYSAIWTTTFVGWDCWDSSTCQEPVDTVTVQLRQRRSDLGFEVALIGCHDESPSIDTSPTVTCATCVDASSPRTKFEVTGTIPGPFNGCGGLCATTRNVTFTITEI